MGLLTAVCSLLADAVRLYTKSVQILQEETICKTTRRNLYIFQMAISLGRFSWWLGAVYECQLRFNGVQFLENITRNEF